jgi:general secretion pathway protein J
MTARPAPPDAGFTLVEALVSLFVFSLIAAGCVMLLVQSVRGQESLDRANAALRDVQITQALMAADAGQIAARRLRLADGQLAPRFSGGLETIALGFVRAAAAPDAARGVETDVVYVEYVFRDGALIRRARRALDPTPGAPVQERVLLRDLTQPRMRFFDGAQWLDAWTGQQSAAAPRAIALEAGAAAFGDIRIVVEVGGR